MYGEAGVGTSAASDQQAGNPFGGPGGFGQREVDLGDIFDSFFGGGMGVGGQGRCGCTRGPVAGDDLQFDLEIDFKTSIFGGNKKVRIHHLETCDTCTGTGVTLCTLTFYTFEEWLNSIFDRIINKIIVMSVRSIST